MFPFSLFSPYLFISSTSSEAAKRLRQGQARWTVVATPLSDFVFAVDSIPAVIGISSDPLIVYSSNVFAILGMRSLYVLIAQAARDLRFLKPSVAAVLFFVALKMIAEYFHFQISALLSLAIISIILAIGTFMSVRYVEKYP
jgi:predicted tellurium resistance membrane protein TerC